MSKSTVAILTLIGAAMASVGSLAFGAESKNEDPKSQSVQQQNKSTETEEQRASSEKPGERHSEQSSAGDQGTVNENQDPSINDRTPHDRQKEMEERK